MALTHDLSPEEVAGLDRILLSGEVTRIPWRDLSDEQIAAIITLADRYGRVRLLTNARRAIVRRGGLRAGL